MAELSGEAADFSGVTDWIFDLDNTLYPRTCNLFAQVDELITQYVMKVTQLEFLPARKLQKDFYRDHGTTLNGLMRNHDVDPDHYLTNVHNIDYSSVATDPNLIAAIKRLPGRKFIFTNADIGHAEAVLGRLGGADLFDGMFDIRATDFAPKPLKIAYEKCFDHFGIERSRGVMFDDLEKNLLVPHEMGMRTVHVVPDADFAHAQVDNWELTRTAGAAHIHHVTGDLTGFLAQARVAA